MVPYHTIAFSQQKLRAALRRSLGQEPAFNYGFVIHSRRHNEKPSLGVITLHGESLALSPEPGDKRLRYRDTVEGESGKANADLRPLTTLVMHISTFDTSSGLTQHLVQVEALVKAESLVQPLIVLTHERPGTWPL